MNFMLNTNFVSAQSVGHNKGLNIAPLYPACLFLLGCHICCSIPPLWRACNAGPVSKLEFA